MKDIMFKERMKNMMWHKRGDVSIPGRNQVEPVDLVQIGIRSKATYEDCASIVWRNLETHNYFTNSFSMLS